MSVYTIKSDIIFTATHERRRLTLCLCTGTLVYCCPEWLERGYYDAEPSEVWSLGCLLYDMVFGDVPFHNQRQIIRAVPFFRDHVSPGIVYILTTLCPRRVSSECVDLYSA